MVKILFCGDIQGNWDLLHERVVKLHSSKHGPFDVVLGVESKLPLPDEFLSGEKKFPLPVHFISAGVGSSCDDVPVPSHNLPSNISFLGKSGLTEINGLSVAFLSGSSFTESEMENFGTQMKDSDRTAVDILLTSSYPKNFQRLLQQNSLPSELRNLCGEESIRNAVISTSPRYHIVGAGAECFFQRLPYVIMHEGTRRVTRLIGLGNVAKQADKSKKWIHALNLQVESSTPTGEPDMPEVSTQSPYTAVDMDDNDVLSKNHHHHHHHERKRRREEDSAENEQFLKYRNTANRKECWFCLASPNIEMHLITSVGAHVYLTLPKGNLVDEHTLIVPITHEQSMIELSPGALTEIEKYKAQLRKYFHSKGMETIVFDRFVSTKGVSHGHLQVFPIPAVAVLQAKQVIIEEGKKNGVRWKEIKPEDGDTMLQVSEFVQDQYYMAVELPSMEVLVGIVSEEMMNPSRSGTQSGTQSGTRSAPRVGSILQFGRRMIARMLHIPRRIDWKRCVVPKEEEVSMANSFKEAFKSYDFTLE